VVKQWLRRQHPSRLIHYNPIHLAHLENERCHQGTETDLGGIHVRAVMNLPAITILVDAPLLDRAVASSAGMSSVAWRLTQEGN